MEFFSKSFFKEHFFDEVLLLGKVITYLVSLFHSTSLENARVSENFVSKREGTSLFDTPENMIFKIMTDIQMQIKMRKKIVRCSFY